MYSGSEIKKPFLQLRIMKLDPLLDINMAFVFIEKKKGRFN